MLLDGRRLLITGVLTEASIAFHVAKLAQEQGATLLLTSAGRAMAVTRRTARRLPDMPDVLELDVTRPDHFAALGIELASRWGRIDGVLHAVGFAPATCLGGDFLRPGWDDVGTTLQISAYSLKALAQVALPLMTDGGGSIVGLNFDASKAWPQYNWMGVAKAALEATARYIARDLGPMGIRVNLVSAGPLKTMSARNIPGFELFQEAWSARAPLGWDVTNAEPVARACVALLSDWFPATTGEIVHVDGGFHAVAA